MAPLHPSSARPTARDPILDAAEAVVADLGAAHLTLDAVVHQAQVSKGGLLYHFPSKDALLQGMLDRLIGRFEERKAKQLAEVGNVPGAALQAHLRTAFDYMREYRRVSAAILAAGANNPRLLEPLREKAACEVGRFRGDLRQVARGVVILLALDGLWFNELLELTSLTQELREAVMVELLEMAHRHADAEEVVI